MNHKRETELSEPLESVLVPKTNFSDPTELQQYKMKYDALFLEFEQEFDDPLILDYFILSKNFLKEWNEFIGFETGTPELSRTPGEFNYDLIESLQETKKYFKNSSQIILRKGLQSKMDYEIVNQKLMDFFLKDFKGVLIPRKAFIQPDGRKFVEVYPKEINAVFLTHTILVEMDKKQRHELIVQKLQCFSQSTIQEFKEHLVKIMGKKECGIENIRLWKISHELEKFFKETQKICNETRSFDYEIPIKGIFLEKNPEVKLEDFGFSETDHLIVELRESYKNWNFVQEGIPTMKKCGFCSKFADNIILCSCKKVSTF